MLNHFIHTSVALRRAFSASLWLLCFLFSVQPAVQGQTTLVNGQWLEIDACTNPTGIIYDNGGPSGVYNNGFDGGCVIIGQPGVTITLQGEYNTESGCDKISVFDGFQQSGATLVNEVSGNGNINVSSTTGYISIRFHTDGSVTSSGFALSYSTSGSSSLCANPVTNLTITGITSTSAQLAWDATNTSGPFTVIINGNTESVSTNSLTLNALNPNTIYTVNVVNTADAASPCCAAHSSFRTLCGIMSAPVIESFDDYGIGVVPTCWVRQKNFDDPPEHRYPQTSGAQYASAPASLMMFCGSTSSAGHFALAIGPEMSDDIVSLFIRFKMRCANANAKIEVGVCDDTTLYDNNFTPVDTITIGSANSWEERVVSMARYTGNGHRIAFRMIRSLQPGNSLVIYIDDLSIEPCGVWHISRRERGINDFWVYWDTIGSPTVDVEIGPQGFFPGSGTIYSDVTSPFHFTGMEPATTYQLRFYSTCGGISREQTGINATTLARDPQPLNLCEGFESNGNNVPSGWRRPDTYNNSPQPSTSYAWSGSRSLWFNPRKNYNGRPIAVLPRIDTVDVSQLTLSFMLRSNYDNVAYLEVGVIEYPEYSSSFVPVDTVSASTSWALKKVNLSSYTGNGRYIAFRAYETNDYSCSIYLDELQVGPCLVTGALVTNIAAHHVELRWDTADAFYHADSVTVEYGPTGFAEGSGTRLRVPVSGSTVQYVGGKQYIVINGLEADSAYQFIVYGDCTPMVQHCSFSRLNARTLEADIPLPYCQQFEGFATGGLPSGWNRPKMNGNCPRIWDTPSHSGDRSLQMYTSGNLSYGNYSLAVMPMFDVDSVRGMTVSFYSYGNSSYYTQYIQVGVMDDPNDASTFTPVDLRSTVYQQWSSNIVDLSSYTGSGKYIAFRNYHNNCNGCGYSAYIDDIIVSDATTANRSSYSVTSHGASFKWQGRGRAYNGAVIEWGPEGFTPGTGHRDTILSTATPDANGYYHYTLDTLQSGVTYNFFITALSSNINDICNYTRQSFTTYEYATAASYCKDFEDDAYDGIPAGWTRPETYSSSPRVIGSPTHSGSHSLYFSSYNCGTPYHSRAVMPYLEESSLDGLTLSFWAYGDGAQTHLAVGMTSDPSSGGAFDTLAVFPVNHWGEWRKYTVDLGTYTGAGRHIVFRWATQYSCNSGTCYLDDITVNRCRVGNVSSYSHTSTTFTIRWTTEGSTDSVEVEYGPSGFTPGSGTIVSNATSPLTISGLTPATGYDYYLRPHCTGSDNICAETKYSTYTLASPVAANWCEDFEAYDTYSRPSFWTLLRGYESHPFVYTHSESQYYTSPVRAFEFRCQPGGSNIIALPAAEEDLSGLILSFNIRCTDQYAPETPSLIVGVMTLPYDTNTFVPIDTIHPSYSYRPVSVSLTTYTGTGRHIAFRYLDDNYRYTYIDDLILSHSRVTDLQASQISDTSITLSWNRLAYSDTTWIAFDTNEDLSTATKLFSTGSSIQFHPLLPGRTYHFHLWGQGQDTARHCQAVHIAVTTLQVPLTVPICEDFEGYTDNMLQGWTFPVDVPGQGLISSTTHSGSRSLALPVRGGTQPRISFAAMPLLPASDISSLYFDAWIYSDYSTNSLTVGIMTSPNDTSTFTPIQTFTLSSYAWRHIKCSLASYSGTGQYIAFRGTTSDGNTHYIYLDDINIRTCAVTQAEAFMPTETSISLQWATTATPQQVYVEYKESSGEFTPGTGTLELITDSPHTFTGLQEATTYTFHVYPVCDGVFDACNYESTTMQTLHPWIDLSYCENFEDISSALPNNWLNLSTGNYYVLQRQYTSSGHNDVPSYYTRFTASASDTVLFVLPRIYLGSQCPILDKLYANFWTLFDNVNISQALFEVGTMTDANDPSTFVPQDTVTPNTDSWRHNILTIENYNTATQYVAFRFLSLDGSWVYCNFDDLCIEKCVAANVSVSDITQNSVTITWDNYSVDTLVCEYGPAGYQLGSGTVITITESPYILTGLADGSQYEFTFATICGCDQFGTAYTPTGGSWGYSGWGGWGWGWWCCIPCPYDPATDCRYWRWGSWHGHSWGWWYSQGGSGNYITPPVIDITTQAAMLETPYCENFEMTDTVAFPPSWRRKQDSHYPDISTGSRHTGDKSLRFYATTGSYAYAALPPVEMGTTASMVLTFYAYSTNYYAVGDNGRLAVGVMTNPDDISTFVPLDTVRLDQTAKWQQFAVSFASYTGEGQYIAFKFSPVYQSYSIYIDDLYLGPCAITGTTTVSTGSNVTVSWTTHNTPDRVLVQYGPQGANPVDADSLFRFRYFTSSPATVTINPDSSYDFFVSAICNDTATASCLVEPHTVNPSLLLPYCEEFDGYENGLLPDRWKVVQRNNNRTQYPLTETQHQRQILAFYPGTGTNNIVCLLPPLVFGDSLAGKWVNVIMSSSASNYIFLDFGYLADTNDASTFVQMASFHNTSSELLQVFNQQLVVPSGATNGNRLAVRARSTSGDRWIRLDRISLSNNPNPMNISYTAHGAASRTYRWSDALPYYTVTYGYGNNWQQVASDSCSATLTGLQPDLDYEIHFTAPDGETLCIPYPFHNETQLPLPYCDNFESYSQNSLPDGWTRANSWTSSFSYPRVEYNVWYYSPYKSLQFYNGCSSNRWSQLTMPDIDIDSIRHLSLRFRMRTDYTDNNNYMIVGVQTEQNNSNTFTPVDTIFGNASWRQYNISLARYSGDGRYITFRYRQTNGSCHYAYIDDLEISACAMPQFSVESATAIKATVAGAEPVDYYIEYAAGSFTQGQMDTTWNEAHTDFTLTPISTVVHVTESPYYITDLEPNTSYTLFTRCDQDMATCAAPATVTTSAAIDLPYCYDFSNYENYSIPPNWSKYNNNSSYTNYPYKYDWYFQFYNYYSYNICQASLPDINIDSIRHINLEFDLYVDYTSDGIIVGVMEDRNNINTFTPVDTLYCTSIHTWQSKIPRMYRYDGIGRYITFRALTTSNYHALNIANLRIQSCPKPTAYLSGGTTVRFDVDTTLFAPDYWIEYGPQGITQLAEDTIWNSDSSDYTLQLHNTILHVTETPFFINNLDANTTYDFYSRCDSAIATCAPVYRITTSLIQSLPLCENFDSYGSTGENTRPTGWYTYNAYYNDNRWPYLYNYSYYSNSCCNSLHFYNYSTNREYAAMPDIDIDSIRHADLTFSMYAYSNYSDNRIVVGVMDNQRDFSTFTPVDTLACTTSGTYQTMHARLSRYHGNGRFIAFRYLIGSSWRELFIDDIRIQACPRPTVSLSAGTTVRFDVDTTAVAPDYWIEYGPQGITQLAEDTVWNSDSSDYTLQPHNTIVHVTETPFFITGLTSNTTYDFFTRCDSAVATCFPITRITTMSTQNLPYCETFSNYGYGYDSFPTDWRRHLYNNDNSYLYVYNDGDAEDSRSLRFYSYSNRNAYAVLPEMDGNLISSLFINTRMWSQSGSNVDMLFLEVGVMTNPYDIGTFRVVDTLRNTASGQWDDLSASLASYDGDGRFIAIRIRENSGYGHSIYLDRLEVVTCDIPANITASLHGNNTVRFDAENQSSTGFIVEYGLQNFIQGNGNFILVEQLPFDLTLDNNTTYDFYFRCDSTVASCRPKQTVTTLGLPSQLPLCEDFESYSNNNMPTAWRLMRQNSSYGNVYVYNSNAHNGSRSLSFYCYYGYKNYAILPDFDIDSLKRISMSFWLKGPTGSSIIVGAMSDPNDISSFVTVKTFNCSDDSYRRCQLVFSSLPNDARFVAFRSNTPNSCCYRYIYLDDLYIDTVGAANFRVTETESNYITFEWDKTGNPDMTIEYGPMGFERGSGTMLTVTSSPYTLENLDPLTNYKFYFDAVVQAGASDNCNTNYSDSASVFTPAGGTSCIDPTNFNAEYTTCLYGSFGNPYANTGTIDYGYNDIRSRHAVHYDTSARDPRTGGLLRMVPYGASASVRLGNWSSNSSAPEGEAITYSLFVDTTAFDLLILKYAAVLQDPLHDPSEQPRFSLDILDTNGVLIDAQCGAANFIANRSLGWNEAADNVLWKDWTTVGVDMSAYAGQTVFIRLTTRDCGEGSHYGYAYFTLDCMLKNMRSELCGDVDTNTFYAPAGFNYRWWKGDDTNTTVSTAQSIKVQTENTSYFCQCSFVDNSNCHFTISAYAGTRYPLASFDYSVEVRDCKFYLTFNNTSTISPDGINPIGTGEPCEAAWWDFGNGHNSNSYNATEVYDSAGTYTVNLTVGIANNQCTHDTSLVITLDYPATSHSLTGPSNLCLGDTAQLLLHGVASFQWNNDWNDTLITFVPAETDEYMCVIIDSNGCSDTLRHSLAVFPTSHNNVYETTTENELPFLYNGNSYSTDALDTLTLTNFAGCDSIVYLDLFVYRNTTATADSTVCEGMLPFAWNDSIFSFAGSKTTLLHTVGGADSTLTMTLQVIPSTYSTYFDTVLENELPHSFLHHTYTNDTVGDTLHIANIAGCDSIITYSLFVHRNVTASADSTVCESSLPLLWNDSTWVSAGTKTTILTSSTGADSILTMTLIVIPTTFSEYYDTVVENDLPHTFLHHTYSSDTVGDTLHIINAAGCDSIITYYLTVHRNVTATADSTVCESSLPILWNDSTFTEAGTKSIRLLTTNAADSILSMTLHVSPTTYDTIQESIIENDLPYSFLHHTYFSDTVGDTLHITNVAGCDSIITYSLTVHRNVTATADSTVCESSLPILWNDSTFTSAGTKLARLHDGNGADSIVTMTLSVLPTTQGTVFDTVVENDLPHSFHHHTYSSDTVGDTLHIANIAGCDSIITYSLFVHRNVTASADSTICESSLPLLWNDSTWVSAGTKTTILTSTTGADSILTMTLIVIPTTFSEYYDTVVENDLPHTFLHHTYSSDTVGDTLHIINAAGCDSIITYSLTVHHNVTATADSTVCESSLPILWNDSTFTSAGSKSTLLHTVGGADSALTMTLQVVPSTYSTYFDTIVENELPHSFHHHTYTNDTVGDTLHIANIAGCDSIITYRLFVHRNVTASADSTICESSLPLLWNDSTWVSAGTKTTILTSSTGADSILTMTLIVIPTTFSEYYDTVVENDLPHTFLHHTYSSDTVGDTLHIANIAGCDSIITYNLTVHHNIQVEIDSTVCESSLPILWNDSTFTEAGNKIVHLFTTHGADSTLTMALQVIPTTYATVYDTIVENDLPYSFHHHTYSNDTVGDTLHITSIAGCDSIITYSLTVHRNVTATADSTICSSQLPFLWNDSTFSTAGTKTTTLTAYTGADSILTMTLNVLQSYLERDTLSLCANELPITWRDTLFGTNSTDGLYSREHTTVEGCDSICTLLLYVRSTYLQNDTIAICQDALPYTWRDTILQDGTVSSDYQLQRTSIYGCDSIMTLNLTVNPIYSLQDTITLCDNYFPYSWRDTLFNTGTPTGIYTIHRTTIAACDSAMTLNLIVNPTDSVADIQEHCDSYTWMDSITYTATTSEPTLTFANRYGCDSTLHLQLTIHYAHSGTDSIESCEEIVWIDGNTYSDPNTAAQYTITTVDGCDSIVTLHLTLLDPTFTSLTDSFCTGTTYLFGDRILDVGGTYIDSLKTVENCDSIVTLVLTKLQLPNIDISTTHDCPTQSHLITATSDVNYLYWTCSGNDWNSQWGSEHGNTLVVSPQTPVTLTLMADYYDYPTCPNTASITLQPISQPKAKMQVTPPFLTYETPTLIALSQSSGADALQWYVDGSDFGAEQHISFTPPTSYDSVSLMLIAYNENCADTAVTVVPYLKQTVFAPNAFTPDEATNNTFTVFYDGIVEYELYIYSRQGNEVFHSTTLGEAWDGQHNGHACPQGSYVWILKYRSEIDPRNWHTDKGTVTLLR